jgi:uncharacterized damage-inducible protein DinB
VWADARLLQAARKVAAPPDVLVRELAHVRGAQETWLARLQGRAATLAVWPTLTFAELERVGWELDRALDELLQDLTDVGLGRRVSYTNSAGRPFTTPVEDILVHLFLHGQYHRGKANAALRGAGAEPSGVDFIMWQREDDLATRGTGAG